MSNRQEQPGHSRYMSVVIQYRLLISSVQHLRSDKQPKSKENWWSSLALGLFTTLVGLSGIVKATHAEEVKEPPHLGLTERELEISPLAIEVKDTPNLEFQTNWKDEVRELLQTDHTIASESASTQPPDASARSLSEANRIAVEEITQPLEDTAPTAAPAVPPIEELQVDEDETISQVEPETTPILAPGEVRILEPTGGSVRTNTTNLVVQYNANTQIQVNVNQNPLDPQTPNQIQPDATQTLITQVWYNIPLEAGENTITVVPEGGTPVSLQLSVEETPVSIQLTPVGDPRLPADGRSTITIDGEIVDERGTRIQEDAIVTLTASAGEFIGADYDTDQSGFQVLATAGQFTAQLQSTLETQKVRIRAAIEHPGTLEPIDREDTYPTRLFENRLSAYSAPIEAYTYVQFITNLRPSLVSGVVNLRLGPGGTDYWGSFRDFLDPGEDDGYTLNVNSAIFATGRIGEWLFTGAYNNERPLNETCDGVTGLFRGPQFCEQQYPVYGDSSTVDYLTPSNDSVYLRFERTSPVVGAEADFFMWGDYRTPELSRRSQLFTATARELHGFKGNYNLGNLQVTAFYSQDLEGFQRDTIRPDGTSGDYFLSRRGLIRGSESVFIESQELNRPGSIVVREQLFRGPDYEIDYDQGTIRFRESIQRTQLDLFGETLARQIVVTYQYNDVDGGDTQLYAGRLQYNFSHELGQESWAGITYLQEDRGDLNFELYGADFWLPLGDNGAVFGEYARSINNFLDNDSRSGNAYRLEVYGDILPNLFGKAYYRSVEENFLNNATTSFVPGQTNYGALLNARVGSNTSVEVSYDHLVNFGIAPDVRTGFDSLFSPGIIAEPGEAVDNELTTIRAGVYHQIGKADLSLEFVNRSREDRTGDKFDSNTSSLVSRFGIPLSDTLSFRAQNELSLGDSDPLDGNRTTLGLQWKAYPGVTLQLAHQFYNGGILDDNSITSLDTIMERQLGENTTLRGRYSMLGGANGITAEGAIGINHRWVIAPGLTIDLGYERVEDDIFGETASGPRFPQPFAVGQSSSALGLGSGNVFSFGIAYTDNPDFKASAQLQHRTGSGRNNTVITAAALGKLSPSLTALLRYQQSNAANQRLRGRLGDAITARLGLAYRNPNNDRFNGLLRYEFRQNPSVIPETLLIDSGESVIDHVFAAEGIYAPSWRWEFYGKFALRHSNTTLSSDFSNSSTIYLGQLRANYRLGYRVDLAVEGRYIGQPSESFNEWGWALEAGYYLTPDLRVGLGYSFGSVDDRDFSGFRSEGGPYLSLTLKVNQLFGGFGVQRAVPRNPEDQAQPVLESESAATTVEE